MSRVEFSDLAKGDLDEIWLHIALDSETAADRLIDRLVNATRPLEDFWDMGVARPELGAGIRLLVIGNYLVFYRRRASVVMVERVLYGHRDITSDLF